MFFIIKKVLFGIVLLNCLLCPFVCKAASHAEFTKIIFIHNSNACLMEDMPKSVVDSAYKKVKRKLFGWNVQTIIKDEKIKYEGDVVFSKTNRTSRELTFNYSYEVENSFETSVSVSGDISISASGKVKGITGTLNGKIRKEIGEKTKTVMSESTRTVLVIPAHTKLTVQLKGFARLNNGVAKYYLFGIGIKKGTWEIIDKMTEYYDYYEEKI